ncbi:MAG: tRNA preQ1(34) S-adenosylmethionine ribosyltransferase-isomerase QueA [Desulfatirhabdiaceae bacterium]
MFALSDYDYDLPPELIAQQPADHRDSSRLLRMNRFTGALSHHHFYDIFQFLNPGDVLVLNNTEVIPGRLYGKKTTGGRVEVLILNYAEASRSFRQTGDMICTCLIKGSKRPKTGTEILFDQALTARVLDGMDDRFQVQFFSDAGFEDILYCIGSMPLPPYIRRTPEGGLPCDDKARYQTVYASQKGAIAAPTAGLHFTRGILERLEAKGIVISPITLHVGYGTFMPVRSLDIREHRIHAEDFTIPPETAVQVNRARRNGNRIVAVGTTCVRTLEYSSNRLGQITAGSGSCNLFIYPGFRFSIVDAMITNFHLPQSTLLMLVSAFAGREATLCAYQEAIDGGYRFYSYGDAMLID